MRPPGRMLSGTRASTLAVNAVRAVLSGWLRLTGTDVPAAQPDGHLWLPATCRHQPLAMALLNAVAGLALILVLRNTAGLPARPTCAAAGTARHWWTYLPYAVGLTLRRAVQPMSSHDVRPDPPPLCRDRTHSRRCCIAPIPAPPDSPAALHPTMPSRAPTTSACPHRHRSVCCVCRTDRARMPRTRGTEPGSASVRGVRPTRRRRVRRSSPNSPDRLRRDLRAERRKTAPRPAVAGHRKWTRPGRTRVMKAAGKGTAVLKSGIKRRMARTGFDIVRSTDSRGGVDDFIPFEAPCGLRGRPVRQSVTTSTRS